MRWRRLARITVKRVKVAAFERQYKPSSDRWVLVRDNDGRIWAGPYRWQGHTFTKADRYWYQFNNVESAYAAIRGHEFVGVTAKQIV
jgi:glutamate-1-semialdehyde aminotransferase